MKTRYKHLYKNKVCGQLLKMSEFTYKNHYQIPKITKILINRGIGDASQNPRILETSIISGQKGIVTQAKHSISGFKIRQKMPVGICVTLRQNCMYNFLDRLVNLAIPRIRDFKGLAITSFDGTGNYSLGLQEQLMFPEIQYDQIQFIKGMDITIVTSAKTDKESLALLQHFGLPFQTHTIYF
uniref:Large ribosomal subunit protein uL5c n=1 Tax=Codium simulans TaxID=589376 RepID=A0A1I9LKJ2_9CHLO|nr:50S ribosomal protein L5 [Codium simulans]ANJ70853.1 50S ribosomal protein L5 [Codium simulans]